MRCLRAGTGRFDEAKGKHVMVRCERSYPTRGFSAWGSALVTWVGSMAEGSLFVTNR
jgi:hypothetical protein